MWHERTVEQPEGSDLFKGAVAGLVAGVAGAWMMTQFQNLIKRMEQASEGGQASEGEGSSPEPEHAGAERSSQQAQAEKRQQEQQQQPATVRAAEVVSQRVLGHELTEQEKDYAGPAMHYGFGAAVGTVYGTLAETFPPVTAAGGTLYGTAVWGMADEVVVPATGLSSPPTQHPPSMHLYALAAHLVYGATVEAVRRVVRQVLD